MSEHLPSNRSLKDLYPQMARLEFMGRGKPECWLVTETGSWMRIYGLSPEDPPDQIDFDSIDGYIEAFDAWEAAKERWEKLKETTKSKYKTGPDYTSPGSTSVTQSYKYTHGSNYSYTPPTYMDGVDRKKWPNTWKWLLKFSAAKDFNKNTRYVYRRDK